MADFGAQAVISHELGAAFPNDPIMAEEALSGVDQDLKEKIVFYAKKLPSRLS